MRPRLEILANQIREAFRLARADEELPRDALAIHDEAERPALDGGDIPGARLNVWQFSLGWKLRK